MSFWRFKFASAGNTIDSLLNALPITTSNPPTMTEIALFDTTLDSLLATADLLSEIKSGTNQKLKDFLAREHVVERLGGWIMWGLGGEKEDQVDLMDGIGTIAGIIADDIEDGKVPDDMVGANISNSDNNKKALGMGRIIRRRDMDLLGVLEGGTDETEEEKACNGYPRLCTEILSSDIPGLTDILYNHEAASSQPETCPSPSSFLIPFWESLLKTTELQLETRSSQVGYWARVNSSLLNGPKGTEILAQILTIPHILPRLLALLPVCSPINDILLLLLRTSKSPSPFTISLIPQTLRMLDPLASLGKDGHIAAEELLRGVIELCSAAAPPLPPPLSNGIGEMPPAHLVDGGLEWRENSLARQIAAERSVQMLVDWILAGTESKTLNTSVVGEGVEEELDAEETPRIARIDLPKTVRPVDPLDDLRTSSLVQSISVLIDLIRKNNSDYVEQQMLTWARRKETEEKEKELEEDVTEDVTEDVEGFESTKEDSITDSDKGPSLVDLGPLLRIIAGRLGGFQELIRSPRSSSAPISTTAGIITPLTQERFRICEFYAELLHCSNMSLVNRPLSLAHLYDSEGYLASGWRAADDLSDALAGIQEDEERDSRIPLSPGQVSRSNYDTSSPVEIPMSYSSGISTPSGQGSLDSESGILTRAEVKELNDVVAGVRSENVEEEDPFGDPSSLDGNSESNDTTDEFKFDDGEEVMSNGFIYSSNHTAVPEFIPPGLLLKKMFVGHRIIETVLDMFFEFPWNNFLHNVVFDLIQQIFHGRIDRELDRQLVLSVFLDGKVINRILSGQAANDIACSQHNGARLGYMGHMSLIAEEVVKLFHHYPSEIYSIVEPHIPQPGWDHYVTTTLRETRERDSAPLGGGISMISHETASSTASGLSDEDDEFPERGVKGRAVDLSNSPPVNSSSVVEESDDIVSTRKASTSSDKFSQYLANAISSDHADKFGSSDEDDEEEDAGWLGGTRFDPEDVDFALSESSTGPTKFGFEDRFEESGKQVFRSISPDSDDDADWGPYSTESSTKKSSTFTTDDGFSPTVTSTSVTFESSFSSFGTDDFASSSNSTTSTFPTSFTSFDITDSPLEVDDDDFGDFETGSSMIEPTTLDSNGLSISLPNSTEVLSDFDFEEDSRGTTPFGPSTSNATTPTNKTFSIFGIPRPSFERTVTADDGSNLFGGLSLDDESEFPTGEEGDHLEQQVHDQEKKGADKATSVEEPLGPSIHEGSYLKDGMVESSVEGHILRVPADEIALAHSRSEEGMNVE